MIKNQEQKIEFIKNQIKLTRSRLRKNDLNKQLKEEVKQLEIAKRYLNARN